MMKNIALKKKSSSFNIIRKIVLYAILSSVLFSQSYAASDSQSKYQQVISEIQQTLSSGSASLSVKNKNGKYFGKLSLQAPELINPKNQDLVAVLKTTPVDMIKMSDLGYPLDKEITIESPWGEQTKPAGKDAFLVWDDSKKQYYMVNSDSDGRPLSYVESRPVAPKINSTASVVGKESLIKKAEDIKPTKLQFVKDAPTLAYKIKTDRFEDIPEEIRKHLGAVDKTKYTKEYLRQNIGSVFALQMDGDKPDFYVIGKETYDAKYTPVTFDEVKNKNGKYFGKLSLQAPELIDSKNKDLVAVLKTTQVDMIKMSDLGYSLDKEITIESPWGEQTKPAGKDAFLVWDDGKKQYYMVNSDSDGKPLSYVESKPTTPKIASKPSVVSKDSLAKIAEEKKPTKLQFVKDAPTLAYRIKSDKFEDIPEEIRKHLGEVDKTKYAKEYLGKNIGSVFALQMDGDKPDFYVIGKETYDAKYTPVGFDEVKNKNGKYFGKLSLQAPELINPKNQDLVAVLKTTPVDMIKMSDLGYSLDKEITIESPWGEQTKPAGKDAFLVWDDSKKQYYMVNSDGDGRPLSYVESKPLAPKINSKAAAIGKDMLIKKAEELKPTKHQFVKDAPTLAFRIKSDKFEDIPEEIRKYLGEVDKTKYSREYLGKNVGSVFALQMNGDKPDFYVIGKDTFDSKYASVVLDDVAKKNGKYFEKVSKQIPGLMDSKNKDLIAVLKTTPTEMVKMSDLGYSLDKEITIESPWGEQTKPAGKDAFLVWDDSKKQYYMVNSDVDGKPLSYVEAKVATKINSVVPNYKQTNANPINNSGIKFILPDCGKAYSRLIK